MTPTPKEICAARKAAKLTQAQAAAVLGVDRRTWQRWEAGHRGMNARDLELFQHKTLPKPKEKYTFAQLVEAIRTAESLDELRRMIGPTEEESEAARQRLAQLDALAPACHFEKFDFQCNANERIARERYQRIDLEQKEFENKYL